MVTTSHSRARLITGYLNGAVSDHATLASRASDRGRLGSGQPSTDYGMLHLSNWFWTIDKAGSAGFDTSIALLWLIIGVLITGINLLLVFRALRYRRITLPDRVQQDRSKG